MLKFTLLSLWLIIIESSDAGVSFVRWGRTVCPTGTKLLYKGYMTGRYFNRNGAGANYLCAHETPVFVRGVPGRVDTWSGVLSGVELDLGPAHRNGLFKNDNIASGELFNQDLLCAVCFDAGSTDKLMIPGRPDCGSTGYSFMYAGFLATQMELVDRQSGEYVCLDEAPEGIPGGSGNNDQSIIYPVEVECGSLPCTSYTDGMEVTCAVCTY